MNLSVKNSIQMSWNDFLIAYKVVTGSKYQKKGLGYFNINTEELKNIGF